MFFQNNFELRCYNRGGIDNTHAVSVELFDLIKYQRIMCTTQDERLNIFQFLIAQVVVDNRMGDRMVFETFFDRRNQKRRGEFINLDKLIVFPDRFLVKARIYRRFCGDYANIIVDLVRNFFSDRIDNVDDGNSVCDQFQHFFQRICCGRITGDNDGFAVLFE